MPPPGPVSPTIHVPPVAHVKATVVVVVVATAAAVVAVHAGIVRSNGAECGVTF